MESPPAHRLWPIVWAPLGVLVIHGALSAGFGHRRELDPLFHFLGGAGGAYAVLQTLERFGGSLPEPAIRYRTAIAVGLVAIVAILWELMEFASDRLLGSHIQRGPADTWSDIALGIGGAMVVALVASTLGARRGEPGQPTA